MQYGREKCCNKETLTKILNMSYSKNKINPYIDYFYRAITEFYLAEGIEKLLDYRLSVSLSTSDYSINNQISCFDPLTKANNFNRDIVINNFIQRNTKKQKFNNIFDVNNDRIDKVKKVTMWTYNDCEAQREKLLFNNTGESTK